MRCQPGEWAMINVSYTTFTCVHVLYLLEPPQGVTTVSTDTSVLVSWQALDPPPDSYRITITYTSTSNLAFTITIQLQVLGIATEVEYSQLIPQQQYTCCVIAVYGSEEISTCTSFQTLANPTLSTNPTNPTPNPSTNPTPNPSANTSTPNSDLLNGYSTLIVGGVLGFVIVVLVLLLVVAGVGLAYLQCVRSRGKENSR